MSDGGFPRTAAPMEASGIVEAFWTDFLARTGRPASTPRYDAFYFGDREDSATALAELVLRGEKVATSSLLQEYESDGTPPPGPGDLSVVTNWEGAPLCVIETTAVEVRAFEDVDAQFAAAEGEGDRSIEGWRTGHSAFFERLCAGRGWTTSPRMPVVCEWFRVVFPTTS